MIDVKMNYKSKYVNNWKCRLCGTEEESYSHLFTRKEYGDDIKEITEGWTQTVYSEKTQKTSTELLSAIKGIRDPGGES